MCNATRSLRVLRCERVAAEECEGVVWAWLPLGESGEAVDVDVDVNIGVDVDVDNGIGNGVVVDEVSFWDVVWDVFDMIIYFCNGKY
ncbi:MAG: hypothetical protein LBP59_11560 [Planctomycetaceae bacterium]|jgi:hypothetical protein|nr:hypothetical protein [Planctomycetaceae bacterium]